MRYRVGHIQLFQSGGRIASTRDRVRAVLRSSSNGFGYRAGPTGIGVDLEDPHRPVPQNGSSPSDDLGERLLGSGADVDPHAIAELIEWNGRVIRALVG